MSCRVVSDLARGAANKNLALHDLDQYVKRPRLAGCHVQVRG